MSLKVELTITCDEPNCNSYARDHVALDMFIPEGWKFKLPPGWHEHGGRVFCSDHKSHDADVTVA